MWAVGSTFACNHDVGSQEVHVFCWRQQSQADTFKYLVVPKLCACGWRGHAITNPALGWITFEKWEMDSSATCEKLLALLSPV